MSKANTTSPAAGHRPADLDSPPSNADGVQATAEPAPTATPEAAASQRRMGWRQRSVVATLLAVVLIPPSAGFYSYFSGVPLHLLASGGDDKDKKDDERTPAPPASVTLVPGRPHTVAVSQEVCESLGIHKGDHKSIEVARAPTAMRPLELPGRTRIHPARLARIRARFAPARVVEIGKTHGFSKETGRSEFRELDMGDFVAKGELLGVFYSVDVGVKKNELLDALVQLELDQKIMDRIEANRFAIPEVYYLTQERTLRGDRNAINRALNNLKLWDIPQKEIDDLHAEAEKISADASEWFKTPEGRWVKGEAQAAEGTSDQHAAGAQPDDPWGRVTLRAPFDGVVIERNVTVGEMVVDNTVNLFQVADVSRMQVIAYCPEDALPMLEDLTPHERRWTVRTAGVAQATGLAGTIDQIGYVIEPNQHTAAILGDVENPSGRLRYGQYVTATVEVPPPEDVVEIPTDALADDGRQSIVFVQPQEGTMQFTMRRVEVVQQFERTVFVRSSPIPKEEQLTPLEAAEGLLPKEPLRPGERVVTEGELELKARVLELESRLLVQPQADSSTSEPAGPAGSKADAPKPKVEEKAKQGKGS